MIASLAALLLAQAQPSPSAKACPYTAGAAVVPVDGAPFAAEPSADGCFLYVPLGGARGGAVAVLENRGGAFRLARSTPLPRAAFGSALSPDGAWLAVAAGDGVDLLSTSGLRGDGGAPALAGSAPLGGGAGAIQALFSRDGALLFVSLERANAVAVLDVAKLRAGAGAAAVIGRIPQPQAPVGLALSPDGARVYAVSELAGGAIGGSATCSAEQGAGEHGAGALAVIDVAVAARDPARAVIALSAAGCSSVRVAASPDGAWVWVTARGEDALLGFRVADLSGVGKARPAARVRVGRSPVGLAITRDGARAWVSDSSRFGGRADIKAVDLAGQPPRVTATTAAAGDFPRDMRVLADGRTVAVAVYTGRQVQIVPAP